jgi:type III pantothenate kinase
MCARVASVLGASTVIATGGLSALIAPYTSVVDHVEPWLTLHGLRLVFERNRVPR